MVTIVDYQKRQKENGEEFFVLILQSGVEMVKSKTTNRFYATAKKCSIPSTFTENVCKGMIGTQMEGSIVKTTCEPYEYAIPETGEVIDLTHRWEYQLNDAKQELSEALTEELLKDFSSNGQILETA